MIPEENRSMDLVTIKSLSFNQIRPVSITKLESITKDG